MLPPIFTFNPAPPQVLNRVSELKKLVKFHDFFRLLIFILRFERRKGDLQNRPSKTESSIGIATFIPATRHKIIIKTKNHNNSKEYSTQSFEKFRIRMIFYFKFDSKLSLFLNSTQKKTRKKFLTRNFAQMKKK